MSNFFSGHHRSCLNTASSDLDDLRGSFVGDLEAEDLALLGEMLGMELELEAQEIPIGDFRADILRRDPVDNARVLIENPLERTDHDHLGKILTYAAGLNVRTVIWKFPIQKHRKAQG